MTTLGEHVPAGMPLGDYNRHPVRQLLALVGAYGKQAMPTTAEIDSLRLGSRDRKALEVGLADVAAMRDDPEHAMFAHEEAERRAGEVIGDLPDEQRDPASFGRVEEDLSTLGPAELAARVKTGAGGLV